MRVSTDDEFDVSDESDAVSLTGISFQLNPFSGIQLSPWSGKGHKEGIVREWSVNRSNGYTCAVESISIHSNSVFSTKLYFVIVVL